MSLQQDKYPQIYPAREIVDSLAYPHAPIEPKKPDSFDDIPPKKYPYLSDNLKFSVVSVIVFITTIFIATAFYNPLIFVILLTSLICSIIFLYKSYASLQQAKTYSERLLEFEKAKECHAKTLIQYEERLNTYLKEKEEFDELVQSLKTQEDIHYYRLAQRHKFLMETKPKERFKGFFDLDGPRNPKLGRAEYFFKDYLANIISNNPILENFDFYFDASIMLTGFSSLKVSYFHPDIMVITPRGLLIDVEIDEPYVSDSKKPIHCAHSLERGDFNRNQYFIRSNCSVVRFSERQIIKYPQQCLDIILAFDDNACIPSDLQLPSDFYENVWTENDAIRMASENFRDTY